MISLFGKNKASIKSVSFPDQGWKLITDGKAMKQWVNPESSIALSINFFRDFPDIPTTKDIDALRHYYRNQIVANNGGLIQVDIMEIKGFQAIKTIFKFPQEPSGTAYLSSITIPFEKCSFVIRIQANETGTVGMRDSFIARKLLKQGKITATDTGYTDWNHDPYSKNFSSGTLMNLSEDEAYDNQFRLHPLSLSRNLLTEIESKVTFTEALDKLNVFGK